MVIHRSEGSEGSGDFHPTPSTSSTSPPLIRGQTIDRRTVTVRTNEAGEQLHAGSSSRVGQAFQGVKESFTKWKDGFCAPMNKFINYVESKKIGKMLEKDELSNEDVSSLIRSTAGNKDLEAIFVKKQALPIFTILDTIEKIKSTHSRKERDELCAKLLGVLNDSKNSDLRKTIDNGPTKVISVGGADAILSQPNLYNKGNLREILDEINRLVVNEAVKDLKRSDSDVKPLLWDKYEKFIPKTEGYLRRRESETVKAILAKDVIEAADIDTLMKCKFEGRAHLEAAIQAHDHSASSVKLMPLYTFLEKVEQFKEAKKPAERKKLFDEAQQIIKDNSEVFDDKLIDDRGKITAPHTEILFKDEHFIRSKSSTPQSQFFDEVSAKIKKDKIGVNIKNDFPMRKYLAPLYGPYRPIQANAPHIDR